MSGANSASFPARIVCLSAESAEILVRLGCASRIAGVTGYALALPELAGKPRIAAFSTAKLDRILALKPDLVLAYSDVQADLAAALVRAGCNVLVTTQRTIAQILDTILLLGHVTGTGRAACALRQELASSLERARQESARLPRRPRVWCEEWMDPLVSAIGWVDELVEIAGGVPLFPELRGKWRAQERTVDPGEVARRNPELILVSWCGRRMKAAMITTRPGWSQTDAVRLGMIREIRSSPLLHPGPAALTVGLRQIQSAVAEAAFMLERLPVQSCRLHQLEPGQPTEAGPSRTGVE
ncbi:MAG: ABC transporter substrate-binding protein [Bryobacteraceae bacterium]|nr:ABC transporter substrate-binding protein [Bryobacteraceae bacterium]